MEDFYCNSCGSQCEKHEFRVNVTDTCKRSHPQHTLHLEYWDNQTKHSRTCNFVGTARHPWRLPVPNMKLLCRFLLFFMQKMYACIKMFLRPPLTQRYFCQFCRNFNKLWTIHTMLDTDKWNTNWSYWIPRTQEKSLGWSSSRIWRRNSSRDRCVFTLSNCWMILLYCTVWLMMYIVWILMYIDTCKSCITA